MQHLFRTALVLAISCLSAGVRAQDWPQWRGSGGDQHAAESSTAPTQWSDSAGLAWKTPIPGRGHSSPTIVGNRIYLTTADEDAQTQSLLILDRQSGKLLAEKLVHRGGFPPAEEVHPNNTMASPTVASDGERVFTEFHNDGAVHVTAFDLAGEQLWQKRVVPFEPRRYQFGFGSSPVVVDGKVIVTSEYDGQGSAIVALDAATGDEVWRTPRPQSLSYSTPARGKVGGRVQLLMSGNRQITAYDPATGKELWAVDGSTYATCGTMVWDEQSGLVFASGGYPESFTLAVDPGTKQIVWQNRVKCYEQSLLAHDGHIYAISDRGIAYCWRATDGGEVWRGRLGGSFSSSPVLVGDKLYVTSEGGTTYVLRAAATDEMELIAENQLGDEAFATPTPLDGRLYHRYAERKAGKRQAYLAAIGE